MLRAASFMCYSKFVKLRSGNWIFLDVGIAQDWI